MIPTDQYSPPTGRAATSPPPPPPPVPPVLQPPAAGSTASPRSWSDRIPELVGGLGTILVVGAVIGFLTGTWADLGDVAKGMVLAMVTAGASAAAVWVEDRLRGGPAIASMLWAAGSAALAGALVLLLDDGVMPQRITLAVGGLGAAGHALVALRRRPDALLRHVAVVAALLFAAGPAGTDLGDGFRSTTAADLAAPLRGLVDPTFTTDRLLITGPAHLVIGFGWLLASLRGTGRVARIGTVGGSVLVAVGAAEALVAPDAIGALVALLAAAGLLLHGLVADRVGRVITGATLLLVTGGRVLWALSSGEVAVTVAALVAGLGLLAWSVRARRLREDAEDVAATADAAPDRAPAGPAGTA